MVNWVFTVLAVHWKSVIRQTCRITVTFYWLGTYPSLFCSYFFILRVQWRSRKYQPCILSFDLTGYRLLSIKLDKYITLIWKHLHIIISYILHPNVARFWLVNHLPFILVWTTWYEPKYPSTIILVALCAVCNLGLFVDIAEISNNWNSFLKILG